MLGRLLLNPWVLIGIGVALAISHGMVWMKATKAANNAWEAKIARVKDQVRKETEERNAQIADELRKLVAEQEAAREAAETEAKELRDAITADKSDTTVRVGPDLDRVFRRSLEIPGDVRGGTGTPGGTGQPALPAPSESVIRRAPRRRGLRRQADRSVLRRPEARIRSVFGAASAQPHRPARRAKEIARAFLALLVVAGPAAAHEWYPPACCTGKDCKPYPAENVKRTPDGWLLHDGTVIPFDVTRPSQDHQFHRCDMTNGKIRVMNHQPCFFAPGAQG